MVDKIEMNRDCLSSLMFWNSALMYAKAARNLFTYEQAEHKRAKSNYFLIGEPEAPLYFLACQAIECALKGYLRGSGKDENFLANECGHNLAKTFKAAEEFGLTNLLKLEPEECKALDLANTLYNSKALQFPIAGRYTFPHFETLLQIAGKLVVKTETFCLDNVKRHTGKSTAVTALRAARRK
jgi:hypothetical protein